MKCENNRCTGCSRRCSLDHPKCKFGCKYSMKLQGENSPRKKYKWEKFASRNGVLGQLILTGRGTKKALMGKSMTEQ